MSSSAAQPDPLSFERLLACELEEARAIQQAMVNAELLRNDRFEVAVLFRPAWQVGGDFLDYFYLSDSTLGFYLGDVVGKGLAAAMYAALSVGTLRGINKTGTSASAVMAMLNERLRMRVVPGRYCAAIYGSLDPDHLRVTYANAGLPRPLHISGSACREVGEGGIPAGMFAESQYDLHAVQLEPGDAMLFTTDGLIEAHNRKGEQFGDQRMLEVCAEDGDSSAEEILMRVYRAVDAFAQGAAQHDDITALALKLR